MSSPRLELFNKLHGDFLQFLKENRLIAARQRCVCRRQMVLKPFQRAIDSVIWRCRNCRKTVSVRKNTFMEKSQLTVFTMFHIILDFICEMPVTSCMSINNISRGTAVQWYEYCREICTQKLLIDKKKLGGPNHLVQVDENLRFKGKNEVGKVVKKFWIVGIYDNTLKKGYVQLVPDRKKETLEAIIVENVEAGSVIFTDMWPSYENLSKLGYTQGTVNHSSSFVDTVSDVCTNNVKAYWARIKRRLIYICGSSGDMRWSHIDEAIYRDYYGMKCDTAWENYNTFIKHVAEIYPQ